jgi:hypothetical protein
LALHPNIEANLQKKIRCMVSLQELVLDFSLLERDCYPNYAKVVEQWLRHFTRLQRITIRPNLSTMAGSRSIPAGRLEAPRPGPHLIEVLNRALGVHGRLANVTGLNDSCTETPWLQPGFPENKGFLLFRISRNWWGNRSVIFHNIWFWKAEQGRHWLGLHQFKQVNPTDYEVEREEIPSILRRSFARQAFSLATIPLSHDNNSLTRQPFSLSPIVLSRGFPFLIGGLCTKTIHDTLSVNLCLISLSAMLRAVT